MSEQVVYFLLIFFCVVCIGICQLGSKESTKTARRFWYSVLSSQIGGLMLSMTDNFILQLILVIATVIAFVLSIVFGILLFKETKKRLNGHSE